MKRYKVQLWLTADDDFPRDPFEFLQWLVNDQEPKLVDGLSVVWVRDIDALMKKGAFEVIR